MFGDTNINQKFEPKNKKLNFLQKMYMSILKIKDFNKNDFFK